MPISFYCLSLSLLGFPLTPAETGDPLPATAIHYNDSTENNEKEEIASLYESFDLESKGLSEQAFAYAIKGYRYLKQKKRIKNNAYLAICDFSQSSRNKRLYILDLSTNEVIENTYVAHGKNSGGEYARRFSNKPSSLQSSLGFYITDKTYQGEHGLSLRMRGLEPGFNDKALKRNIVIHGAGYIEEDWLKGSRVMGRSYGCPAIPKDESAEIINIMKNGNCLFIYHPSKNYLKGSKILNG